MNIVSCMWEEENQRAYQCYIMKLCETVRLIFKSITSINMKHILGVLQIQFCHGCNKGNQLMVVQQQPYQRQHSIVLVSTHLTKNVGSRCRNRLWKSRVGNLSKVVKCSLCIWKNRSNLMRLLTQFVNRKFQYLLCNMAIKSFISRDT